MPTSVTTTRSARFVRPPHVSWIGCVITRCLPRDRVANFRAAVGASVTGLVIAAMVSATVAADEPGGADDEPGGAAAADGHASLRVFAGEASAGDVSADDPRWEDPKTLNGHFPFEVPESVEAWEARREALRRRVLVATGLWPMPEKTPLNAVIHGAVERDGFRVERVYFESLPGHFVTGLLFRPEGDPADAASTPRPGVLCPHGHGGRMQRLSDSQIAQQIESGAEKHEKSGRYPKLARCAQLARMGCVTFIFDMLGYADSIQIEYEVSHRHRDPRPEEREPGPWCLFSPQADLRLQSVMGLQTWNAVRALDFLASLPDVDPDRLAVTGGSGGGTQTILLGAIDPRPRAAFPNGMVSTSMQGGCYCENCCLLRIDTGNVELAAMFAPRPQAMTAADDWTRDMMTDGFPELRRLYGMLGVADAVDCYPLLHFPHNYNYVTRAKMYSWMNRHLELGIDEPIVEGDFEPLSEDEASVWNDEHPAPEETGIAHERKVLGWFDEQATRWLEAARPTTREEVAAFHESVGAAWGVLFDQPFPEPYEVTTRSTREAVINDVEVDYRVVFDVRRGVQVPVLVLSAAAEDSGDRDGVGNRDESGGVVIWCAAGGKRAARTDDGEWSGELRRLLDAGATVVCPDLFGQGELAAEGREGQPRLVDDEREYSAFTFGYNRTLVAERVADLNAVIAAWAGVERPSLALVGQAGTAAWALPAAAASGHRLTRVVVDTDGFRFADVPHFSDPAFVPGAVKYGDLPALMALRAPYPLRIVGDGGRQPGLASAAYGALEASNEFVSVDGELLGEDGLRWLLP